MKILSGLKNFLKVKVSGGSEDSKNNILGETSMKLSNDNKDLIIKRITNLITIKSIISLSLLFVFCYLIMHQIEIPESLETVFGYVIMFFLGSQVGRKEDKEINK